ncbi:hypothetical protein BpHYR1_041800 [Brachionus plicatilis]|uniref:Uncharacterized protein n=1 Tax=Brachionus plicatilis TaxID=10195 RepID=A0A3M7QMV7_BRAPC|nr:hypothetical protein BpHYR1_041800 [Brachionus plicatilis]
MIKQLNFGTLTKESLQKHFMGIDIVLIVLQF